MFTVVIVIIEIVRAVTVIKKGNGSCSATAKSQQ